MKGKGKGKGKGISCNGNGGLAWVLLLTLAFGAPSTVRAQQAAQAASVPPSSSVPLAQAPTDQELLELFEGLRVSDVTDGMDIVGLRGVGLVDTRFQALWKDLEKFDHQFRGIALTVRYVPQNRVVPNPIPADQYARWESEWYTKTSPEPFLDSIRPGHVIVIDGSGNGDVGTIGSYNALEWIRRGALGVVTTGSIRDTDEVIKERIPVYFDPLQRGRGIRPGRNMIESVNRPVTIGGALVRPGDVVVADGDGVVVVPREYAPQVARAAREIMVKDKAARRDLYQRLGRPLDATVKP